MAHAGHINTVGNIGVAGVQPPEIFKIMGCLDRLVLTVMGLTQAQLSKNGIRAQGKSLPELFKGRNGVNVIS